MRYGSVCSGIEAASVAWEQLGWQPAWFAEIEAFPSAVLATHWPEVANLGDMTKIASAVSTGQVEAPDILVGGTPCQAFSIAGLREGLSDDRGQLTLSYVELANAIDNKRREREGKEAIIVWENVPGVLSSKDNAFGCFLAGLAGESSELQPPGGKWTHAGCVSGPQRVVAWRVLDAQFFGVAQRRRRVFVVASARADIDPAKILFELGSVRRDTAPSRGAGKAVAALTANGVGTCGADDNQGQAGHLIPQCVTGDISHTLKAEGFDGSEDGTGRGTPIIAMAHGQGGAEIKIDDSAPTLTCNHEAPIVFSSNGHASFATGVGALRAKSGADHETLAVHGTQDPDTLRNLAHTLGRNNGQENAIIAYGFKGGQGAKAGGIGYAEEQAPTLTSASSGTNLAPTVMQGMSVRRLTPIECERLQGFPDNHTSIPVSKRKQITEEEYAYQRYHNPSLTAEEAYRLAKDGPRYKALGNSMAVPVMRWIGAQIKRSVVDMSEQEITKSHYVCALDELREQPAHKLKEIGDQWRTPDLLFWGINAMFGPLVLDLFADDDNAKCPAWYTAEDNALTQDWSTRLLELGGAGYGNPPYSRSQYHEKQAITGMRHIIAHTLVMREQGGRYVFLIKAATGEVWWPEEADHVAFIRGRISFDLPVWYRPEEGQPSESSAGFSAAIAVFDKSWCGERFSYISRTVLEEKGRAAMALAAHAIGKLQPPATSPHEESTAVKKMTEVTAA